MRKQLTPEQAAKRDERRAKFKTLWKQVADMPEIERVEMSNKLGLITCEGHPLSLCNTMLVALQLPGATVLGGFRQWLKHSRCVRKGEHGAMIWVPIGNGKAATPENPDPASNGEHNETRFIIGTVFDISQTQEVEAGEPAPIVPEMHIPETPKAEPTPQPETREMVLASMTQNFFGNLAGQLAATGSAT